VNATSTHATRFVLRELTWSVRVFTTTQVERMLRARYGGDISARSLIQRCRAENLIRVARTAVAFHEAGEPIASRERGQPAPRFGALAWQLEKRWRDLASRRVTICWATPRAARLCAGVAGFDRRVLQLEHDLGTASVLVSLHQAAPEIANQWVGEDILRRDFAPFCTALNKIPDAALLSGDHIVRVIEYGGQYSATRLRQFDSHFHRKHHLPYDIY